MRAPAVAVGLVLLGGLAALCLGIGVEGQEPAPPADLPAVPEGVEVQARGPVHEAFASLAGDPAPTKAVAKKPPAPLEEMPPDQKPEGDVTWIGGYWAWDDDRSDFLWVSGTWRTPPPGKKWVAGYWREDGGSYQWIPGFWTTAAPAAPAAPPAPGAPPAPQQPAQNVTYYPAPPAPPEMAAPGAPPAADTFLVPGTWAWGDGRYQWRAGYWARVQPGYVWVPAHFRWTPGGYIFIPGYWDLAVARRGVLYAPVVITPGLPVNYVYTPTYVVSDTIVLDSLFVRPAYCHYYFGDYYGPAYVGLGFESCYVYSQRRYDSIIVYERWDRRNQPGWINIQISLYNDRFHGRAPLPPRTLVQQNIIIREGGYRGPVLMTHAQFATARGTRLVAVEPARRQEFRAQAVAMHHAAVERHQAERAMPPVGNHPREAHLPVHDMKTSSPAHPAAVAPGHTAPGHPVPPAHTVPGHVAPAPPGHPGTAPHASTPPPPGHAPPPGHPAVGHPPGAKPGTPPGKHPPDPKHDPH